MGIDISCLSPDAQAQIMRKLAEKKRIEHEKAAIIAELRAEADLPPVSDKKRKNKLNANKCTYNGIEFDSKREMKHYAELDTLQRAGRISNLQRQVIYELVPKQKKTDGTTERAVKYIADFQYTDADGNTVVEDTKGYRGGATYSIFVIKRKLMLYRYGIEVKEV